MDVSLTVTGPIDNMNLSYTSDPPLQFQEIVALLATGKTPTSDRNDSGQSAIDPAAEFRADGRIGAGKPGAGRSGCEPLAARVRREPIESGSDVHERVRATPGAAHTAAADPSNVTFTYVTDLNNANTQIIRAEWAFNPQWSAVATRDQNGIFSINFFYKKQFR